MTSKERRVSVKEGARKALNGKWGVAIAVLIVAMLITSAASSVFANITDNVLGVWEARLYEQADERSGGAISEVMNAVFRDGYYTITSVAGLDLNIEINGQNIFEFDDLKVSVPDLSFAQLACTYVEITGIYEPDDPVLVAARGALFETFNSPEYSLLGSLSAGAALISLCITLVFAAAMSVGQVYFFIRLTSGDNAQFKDLFFSFKKGNFWRTIGVYLLFILVVGAISFAIAVAFIFALIMLLAVPAIIVAAYETAVPVAIALLFYAVVALLCVGAGVLTFFIVARFSMSLYLFARFNGTCRVGDTLGQSARLMRGHLWEYFVYTLSWLGWNILSALTFGILRLYVAPYRGAADEMFFASLYDDGLNKGLVDEGFLPPPPPVTDSGVSDDWAGLDNLPENAEKGEDNYSAEG